MYIRLENSKEMEWKVIAGGRRPPAIPLNGHPYLQAKHTPLGFQDNYK